jgi:hypothetical protein
VQRTSQVSFVDVYRRWRRWLRRSGPRRRERLRRDVHERRPRGDRRNRRTRIHARPQQRHAGRIAGSRRSVHERPPRSSSRSPDSRNRTLRNQGHSTSKIPSALQQWIRGQVLHCEIPDLAPFRRGFSVRGVTWFCSGVVSASKPVRLENTGPRRQGRCSPTGSCVTRVPGIAARAPRRANFDTTAKPVGSASATCCTGLANIAEKPAKNPTSLCAAERSSPACSREC